MLTPSKSGPETIHGLVKLSLSIGRGRSRPNGNALFRKLRQMSGAGQTRHVSQSKADVVALLEADTSEALFRSSHKMDMDGRRRGVPRWRSRGQVHQPDWLCDTCGSIRRFLHFRDIKELFNRTKRRMDPAGTWRAVRSKVIELNQDTSFNMFSLRVRSSRTMEVCRTSLTSSVYDLRRMAGFTWRSFR
jgi:hypothetical protein